MNIIGDAFTFIVQFSFGVVWRGLCRSCTWKRKYVVRWTVYLTWLIVVTLGPAWSLGYIIWSIFSWIKMEGVGIWVAESVHESALVSLLFLPPFLLWLGARGYKDWSLVRKYDSAIKHLGLKTPTGIKPTVLKVIELENHRKRVIVQAVGIDVKSFRDKKGSIDSSFNTIVQDISVSKGNRQNVEILISDKELPSLVTFESRKNRLKKPYSFLVGESFDNFIVANLCDIHHLLVAGTTGGGKSYFFKQAITGLLKSSQHIQVYLIDLKKGVETRPFRDLQNVRVAKDEPSAITYLQAVVDEMNRRFDFLEEKGFNEIDPARDGFDRIVVAVDEASNLFTLSKSSKEVKDRSILARELTDKIAKLGRAAAIHLILATQKVVKDTIDTRVQTNINAKVCFKVNSIPSSTTVLGNKNAFELPSTKGRAIWSYGTTELIVQVPRLNPDELNAEIELLKKKFNTPNSPVKMPMLSVGVQKKKKNPNVQINDQDIEEVDVEESK